MKRVGPWIIVAAVASSLSTYALTGGPSGRMLAQVAPAPGEQPPAAANAKLVVDEHEIRWNPVNAYRIHTTAEEVVLDLGYNMLDPNPNGVEQTMLLRVSERNVMSYTTAKRLRDSLGRVIQQYEQKFGPIQSPPAGR